MNRSTLFISALTVLFAVSATACAGLQEEAGSGEDDIGNQPEASLTANSLTANSLTANSLTANSLTANSLTANSLTANSLTANSLTAAALRDDPAAQKVLFYIVGCALPADQSITLSLGSSTLVYNGQLGLAPEWGVEGNQCDGTCQSWISACVLSRLNFLGVSVPLSVRGSNPSLSENSDEIAQYPRFEATFFGDIFRPDQIRRVCLPSADSTLSRVCGSKLDNCAVTNVGTCNTACTGLADDGGYSNCRDGAQSYEGAISVFLQ